MEAKTPKRKGKVAAEAKATPVASTSPGLFAGQFGGVNINADRVNLQVIYGLWRSNGDLFGCVREICSGVGVAGFEWVDKNGEVVEPTSPAAMAATQALNVGKTFRRLKSEMVQSSAVSGNAYLHIERGQDRKGSLIKVTVIDPRTMRVVTDKYGTVLKWIQQAGGDLVTFTPEEILHFVVDPDPNSSVFGISPIETIVWDIRSDLAAAKSNYAFFENDATPATQYILDDGISDEEYDKLVEKLKQDLQGAENKHKTLAVKGVKEIKTLSLTNKEMEFELLRRLTTEKVCSVMGVPKSLLNYTDNVNYSNGAEQTKKFWEGTIEPWQELLAEFINARLLPALGIDTSGLTFRFSKRTFDDMQWIEASTRADVQLGIMTVNEARERRKMKTYDVATEGEYVNKPILFNGAGAIPLEDVGIDPMADDGLDPNEDPAATEGQDGKLMLVKPRKKIAPPTKPNAKTQR